MYAWATPGWEDPLGRFADPRFALGDAKWARAKQWGEVPQSWAYVLYTSPSKCCCCGSRRKSRLSKARPPRRPPDRRAERTQRGKRAMGSQGRLSNATADAVVRPQRAHRVWAEVAEYPTHTGGQGRAGAAMWRSTQRQPSRRDNAARWALPASGAPAARTGRRCRHWRPLARRRTQWRHSHPPASPMRWRATSWRAHAGSSSAVGGAVWRIRAASTTTSTERATTELLVVGMPDEVHTRNKPLRGSATPSPPRAKMRFAHKFMGCRNRRICGASTTGGWPRLRPPGMLSATTGADSGVGRLRLGVAEASIDDLLGHRARHSA